jgi:hypothetical protein
VKLDADHNTKRSEQAIIMVCVLHIPEMMILEGAYETEIKAINLIKPAKVKITFQMCDGMGDLE